MAFKKYGKKRVAPPKRRGAKGFKKVVRKAKARVFKKRVLSVVSSSAETKVASWRKSEVPVGQVLGSNFSDKVFTISPSSIEDGPLPGDNPWLRIQQGVGQGDRVGNKVNCTYARLKGVVRPNMFYTTTNYNPCPFYVQLWVVSLAKHLDDTVSILDSVIDNSFFQAGNVSRGFTGKLIDLTQQVNTSHITVHAKRVLKLGNSTYVSGYGVGSAASNFQSYANNDFSLSKFFNMRLKFQKSIVWNDGSTNPSNMRRWYFFAVPYRVDGQVWATSTGDVNAPTPLLLDFDVEMKFKDM